MPYIIIAILVGGGEIREPASATDCVAVQRLQILATVTGKRRWVVDRDTGRKQYVREFLCIPASEVPLS